LAQAGMGAAPGGFAMGVEDDEFDLGEIVAAQQLADADAQPLDPEGRGDLPDIATRIGIAELNAGKDSTLEVTADDLSTAKFLHFSHDEIILKTVTSSSLRCPHQ